MILNQDGKIFGKISVVDFFVTVMLILGIGILALSIPKVIASKKTEYKCIYTMEIKDVRQSSADAIVVGDEVYNLQGMQMGKILSKSVEPFEGILIKEDGTVIKAVKPGRFQVLVTVEADCTLGKGTDTIVIDKGDEISIGAQKSLFTKTVAFESEIKDVRVTKK